MKILWVGTRVPYPVRDGGNARSYHYLRELGRRHDVSYLCRGDRPRPDAEQHLGTLCRAAEVFVDPLRLGVRDRLRTMAAGYPFGVVTPSDAFFRRFREVLRREAPDLVYLAGVDTALLSREALVTTAVAWDAGDCTSRYYERQARGEPRRSRRLWYRLQAASYRRLEQRLLQQDLAVFVASPSEAEAMRPRTGQWRSRVDVVAHGIDPVAPATYEPGPPRLAFTGTLDYPPNVDAILYFCRDVLPRVRLAHPDLRLQIIGGGAAPELVSACQAAGGVDFLGFVPDVFDVLRHVTVFVCPMRQGTGIKVKLLEAMACGLPAVATPVAVEGLPEARDGFNLRVAASADELVGRLLELLGDAELRRRLGGRARELMTIYAWDRLGERLDRLCRQEVAHRHARERGREEDRPC